MTNQNPAPSAVYPSGDERVQPATRAAAGEVEVRPIPDDDLDALSDLPLIIARWVFERRGVDLTVAEARRCARAALAKVPSQ